MEGPMGVEKLPASLSLYDVPLLVDDEARDVGEPLGDFQLAQQVRLAVRLLVDEPLALLRLGLGLDGRLHPDHFDDAGPPLVGDAIDLGVGRLCDLDDTVARGTYLGPC